MNIRWNAWRSASGKLCRSTSHPVPPIPHSGECAGLAETPGLHCPEGDPASRGEAPEASEKIAGLAASRRIPELDGLRGLAIALVLATHWFNSPLRVNPHNPLAFLRAATNLSWSGVELFFVLSGFLIGGILMDARGSENYFRVFYVRRICRIVPVYFIFLALWALGYRFLFPLHAPILEGYFANPMPWYSYVTFTSNFWMARANVFGAGALGITWSLCVEEQFYLTLPFVVRFVRPRHLLYVLGIAAVAAPVFRIAGLILYPHSRLALYVLLPARMDALLLGVSIAYLLRRQDASRFFRDHRRWLWGLLAVLTLGLGVLTIKPFITGIPMVTAGYDWISLFYATMLALVLVDPRSWLGRAMRCSWLMSLGTIAYAVYLIHETVYALCMAFLRGHGAELSNLADLAVTLLALALVIGVAKLSWRFFEKPLVGLGHRFQYRNSDGKGVEAATVTAAAAPVPGGQTAIALLGARDNPVDGVEDYCGCLSKALARSGLQMRILRVPWDQLGWLGGVMWLRREARSWRGRWVFVQYTALNWSRHGFSLPVLVIFAILKVRGARCAVVFHDASPYGGKRLVDHVRTLCQTFVMRSLYRNAELAVATIAPGNMAWLSGRHKKIVCIPVGANLPDRNLHSMGALPNDNRKKTVAVFSVTGGRLGAQELDYVACAVGRAAEHVPNLRLIALGRNSAEAGGPLRRLLSGLGVEIEVFGLLSPEAIIQTLAAADVLLFVRAGGLSSRRGSAIAGIVCGVPVVGFSSCETGPPITEAGVLLAPEGDRDALAKALTRALSDDALRADLRKRNLEVRDRYFSWDAISETYLRAMKPS
jgi:peptidoglycan/LPS O-acetylase OafA/YrhL